MFFFLRTLVAFEHRLQLDFWPFNHKPSAAQLRRQGADIRFNGWAESDDAHPAAANAMAAAAATPARNGLDFLTIALRLDGPVVV